MPAHRFDYKLHEKLDRRKYCRVIKSKKEHFCDRCSDVIPKHTQYEHSLAAEGGDIHLCRSCANRVRPKGPKEAANA